MAQVKQICTDCYLYRYCSKTLNNRDGWGNPDAKLVIVLEDPGHHLSEKLLIWMLQRLSITGNDVWIDYNFRCPTSKKLKKAQTKKAHSICWTSHPRKWSDDESRVVVLAGNFAAEFLADAKMKEWNGKKHPESGCWIIYSFNYQLMNANECKDASCVLYKAAEEAGLTPKFIVNFEKFNFPPKKLAAND